MRPIRFSISIWLCSFENVLFIAELNSPCRQTNKWKISHTHSFPSLRLFSSLFLSWDAFPSNFLFIEFTICWSCHQLSNTATTTRTTLRIRNVRRVLLGGKFKWSGMCFVLRSAPVVVARFSASIFDLQIIFAFHTNDLCFYSSEGFRFLGPGLINCVT